MEIERKLNVFILLGHKFKVKCSKHRFSPSQTCLGGKYASITSKIRCPALPGASDNNHGTHQTALPALLRDRVFNNPLGTRADSGEFLYIYPAKVCLFGENVAVKHVGIS